MRKAYDWALAQPVRQVFASEFMRIADSFNHVVLAHDLEDDAILVRNAGSLRSLRIPASLGEPDLTHADGIAGWGEGPDGHYLALTAPDLRMTLGYTNTGVRFAGSNGRVVSWSYTGGGAKGELLAHVPLEFDLSGAQGCVVKADQRAVRGMPDGKLLRFKLNDVAATLEISCRSH